MSSRRQTYKDRAERLARTVDIAELVIKTSDTLSEDTKSRKLQWGQQIKQMALNPEPQFKRVASIKYLENDFLTYWNEASGPEVEKFWTTLNKSGIDFERKDMLNVILKRGRIKDIHEYDYVVDSILVAEQTGKINSDQVVMLNGFLGAFEQRNAGKDL
jgi:hypothetical protein